MFARALSSMAALVILGAAVSTVGVVGQVPPAAAAQSAALTKELLQLLAQKKLTSIAAKDPGEAGRYVAALNVAGVELLVVSAKADPVTLDYRLYQHDYATAYADLNSSVDSTSKLFITDEKADGLVARPLKDTPLDSIVQDGKEFAFDGDPKRLKTLKLTPQDYDKRFTDADQAYTHILNMLISELKKG